MNEIYPRSAWLTFVRVMVFLSIFTAGSFNHAGASTPAQNPTHAEQQSPSLPGFETSSMTSILVIPGGSP